MSRATADRIKHYTQPRTIDSIQAIPAAELNNFRSHPDLYIDDFKPMPLMPGEKSDPNAIRGFVGEQNSIMNILVTGPSIVAKGLELVIHKPATAYLHKTELPPPGK